MFNKTAVIGNIVSWKLNDTGSGRNGNEAVADTDSESEAFAGWQLDHHRYSRRTAVGRDISFRPRTSLL